jgi:5-methylcytosine-specific restriction endonuclease McrA
VVLHLDHIKPKSKGGDNSESNLTTACLECNIGKNNIEL